MKTIHFFKTALLVLPMLLASCSTSRKIQQETAQQPAPKEVIQKQEFLQKVSDNAQHTKFITSKMKFSVSVGSQEITLTGNLKMKRDDVIRLQLMAFGFVEAGRLEFTKDYVLIIDRINKQYIKAPYSQLEFLRYSGLNFYSLQALFWNELFLPGQTHVTDELLKQFNTDMEGDDAIISFEQDKMSYRWLAGKDMGLLKMANILYSDKYRGNTQLNWDYLAFKKMGSKQFPTNFNIRFSTPKKEVKMGITLNYLDHESEWETRTELSNKYKEVSVDEILRRFMAL